MRVMGNYEPKPVELYTECGVQHVRLARNASNEWRDEPDGTSHDYWEWDELTMPCDAPIEQVESSFGAYWHEAELYNMTDAERIAGVERAAAMLEDAIVELAEVIGGE